MQQITPHELKQRMLNGKEPLTLVDVREQWEYELCNIEGSVHIPMNLLLHQLVRLKRTNEIVVICHHGVRSQQAAMLLERNGFKRVTNLTGGIHHWALQIEPEMPRY